MIELSECVNCSGEIDGRWNYCPFCRSRRDDIDSRLPTYLSVVAIGVGGAAVVGAALAWPRLETWLRSQGMLRIRAAPGKGLVKDRPELLEEPFLPPLERRNFQQVGEVRDPRTGLLIPEEEMEFLPPLEQRVTPQSLWADLKAWWQRNVCPTPELSQRDFREAVGHRMLTHPVMTRWGYLSRFLPSDNPDDALPPME